MRQVVLDTETTGLDPVDGHRIIEIGGVEILNRRLTGNDFHQYLQPDREIDPGAVEVHGITNEMLADKPRFSDITADLIRYLRGAELVIHNAPFDVGFLDSEFTLAGQDVRIADLCEVTDSLVMARRRHPGQRNTLDALCKRYEVDASRRELHGALLDAQLLADVYLGMTGGQTALQLETARQGETVAIATLHRWQDRRPLRVISPTAEELREHERMLDMVTQASGGNCLWRRLETGQEVSE